MRSITGCTPTFQQATERIRSNGREASGERVRASECVHACVRVRVCLPTSRPFCPSASLSACPSVRPSVDVFACLSACAPVPLSLCVSVDLSVGVLVQCLCVCRCVHLPVCLSIFACGRARACLRPCVCASLFAQVRACASACVCACACVPRARVCGFSPAQLSPSRLRTGLTPATSAPGLNGRTPCQMPQRTSLATVTTSVRRTC